MADTRARAMVRHWWRDSSWGCKRAAIRPCKCETLRPGDEVREWTPRHAGNFFRHDDVWTQRRQRRKLGGNQMGTQIAATTGESAKLAQWRLKITFWLDVTLLVSICALQTVRFTGLILHEWLGLAVVGMVLAHLLLAWSWIVSQSRRFFTLQSISARINYLLNLSLFAAVTAAIYSGILISQKAIPTLTRSKAAPDMAWRWDTLHHQFSQIVVMLVGFHLAINWEWVLAAGQRIFRRFLEGAR